MVGDVRAPLLLLLGAVGFVLLVACANVANLLLARGSARHGELSVRSALGAGRPRLIRQLVTESILLGVIGGTIGLALGYAGTSALIAARPADLPRIDEIRLDGTVVWFTARPPCSRAWCLACPGAAGDQRAPAARPAGKRTQRQRRATHRIRATLVVAEMALAVVLLTGAGLLIRSFLALTDVDPGFQPGGAMALRVSLQGAEYKTVDQVRSRVAHIARAFASRCPA